MHMRCTTWAFAALLATAGLGTAQATGNLAVAPHASHQQECGACHVAYPPGLLPAASWARIMARLNQHFGTDASLDENTARDIGNWLQVHAGTDRRGQAEPPQDRITRAAWFLRQHDEVASATWKRASIGSAANCAACHADAAKGDFNEHRVRIPK